MILVGDCRERLRELPERSVQTCVTSPPYFGLRDYANALQIGLEPTPDEFVAALVGVFREVRRVLRDDGTVWLNLGDSYAAARSYQVASSKGGPKHAPAQGFEGSAMSVPAGMKAKDLIGIPWMVAFALRADGWYLRSEIIWAKRNCMPESVTDRPTKAHEQIFLLTKRPSYFFDADAIRESDAGTDHDHRNVLDGQPSLEPSGGIRSVNGGLRTVEGRNGTGRNKRSVWTVATQPYAGAHFATFPPKLIEPCILAGSPPKCCGECGAPWRASQGERKLDTNRPQARRALALAKEHGLTDEHIAAIRACGVMDAGQAQEVYDGYGRNDLIVQALADEAKAALGGYHREFLLARPTRTGYSPSCVCEAEPVPSVVLDPFAGSGTTGVVAGWHGRDFVGCELNPEYAAMAEARIALEGRPGGKPENHEHPNVHDDQLGFEVAS